MTAQVTLTGEVTRDVEEGFNLNIKEEFLLTYKSKDGEQVSKTSTRYWSVWLNHRITVKAGSHVIITGAYSTVSGEPKADGKVWPNHKISDATCSLDTGTPVQLTQATDLLTQLSDVPF